MNVRKIVGEAGTLFNRAVQYTEEKLGTSEKTELDAHFETLSLKSEVMRKHTEKLVNDIKAALVPNPAYRLEEYVREKIDKPCPHRLSNLEYLGNDMIDAGITLMKVGMLQQKLGQEEREFIQSTAQNYINPLTKFLEGEVKTIQKEKKLLEIKRLDLDACKNRLKKAKNIANQHQNKDKGNQWELIEQAQSELQVAQDEFDKQTEVTRLLLENVSSVQAQHLRHLIDFVECQAHYYTKCSQLVQKLQLELTSPSVGFGSFGVTSENSKLNPVTVEIDLSSP